MMRTETETVKGDKPDAKADKPTGDSGAGKSGDDKLIAAFAHASALVTTFTVVGIVIPLLIWLLQKDKSRFIEFQAKQALFYQSIVLIISFVLGIATFIISLITLGLGAVIMVPLLLLFGLAAIIYGLYAAYKTYEGEDFKYYLLGDWLQKQ